MRLIVGKLILVGLLLPVLPLLTGCGPDDGYVTAPPPPPPPGLGYYEAPSLVRVARANGFRDGFAEGVRDRDTGHSFRPTHSDRYEDCPGYYNEIGPREYYKQYYREAYQHGYRDGYARG